MTHTPTTTTTSVPELALQACDICSKQKKRCDKALPTCGPCKLKGRECCYPELRSNDRRTQTVVKFLHQRLEQLEGQVARQGQSCEPTILPRPMEDCCRYPIPRKWYFSSLLSQRMMFFDPVSQQYPNSVAHKLQTTCLQAALSDPCLFHATLFSTSAFLDFAQGMRDNPVTTYHKAETIRMVQDAISKSDSDGLPDSIITATTYLLCIAGLHGDVEEGNSHEAGLTAILRFRGLQMPGPETVLGYFLILRNVWNAFARKSESAFPATHAGPKDAIGSYTSLLSTAVQKQLERPTDVRLPLAAMELIVNLNNESSNPGESSKAADDQPTQQLLTAHWTAATTHTAERVQRCCHLAVSIYRRALLNERESSLNENQQDVLDLVEAADQSDEPFWLCFGPEVFRWVLMTGAAAASSISQRAWFIARTLPFAAIMQPEELHTFVVGADHLLQLFNHRE